MDIKKLAKKCGVSTMTVSRAFGNHQISEDTRKTILSAAKKYNYRPNIVARSLVRRRSQIIGLVVPNIIQSYFPHIIRGVEQFFNQFGYNLILCDSQEDTKKEEQQIRLLIDQRVAGVIVIPAAQRQDSGIFSELKQAGTPFVLIDRYVEGVKASFVGVDNHHGALIATEHLIHLGHKKIMHLRGPRTASMAQERFSGYRDALKKAGIGLNQDLIIESGLDEKSGQDSMMKVLGAKVDFSAVFAVNDPVAVGAMKAMHDCGLRIPEDISLVGFANNDYTPYLRVALTTINQPKEEIGEAAGKLLLEEISGKKKIRKVLLKTELVLRDSTDLYSEEETVSSAVE